MPLPAYVLDAPAPPPARPGLFTVATGPMPMPEHAQTSGAIWQSEACGSARLYPSACQDVTYAAFVLDATDGLENAFPFNVYASQVCGAAGVSAADAERIVRQKLELADQRAAEQALWGGGGGVTGIFQQLQAAGQVTALAASTNVAEAVSILEQQGASTYDGPLIIHARPRMAAYLATKGLIKAQRPADGERLSTHFGTSLSFGGGYAGTGPAGEAVAATTEYMWITGRVLIWRSDIWVSPPDLLIDRSNNQRGLYAFRSYMIAVECVAAATLVTKAGAVA